MHKTILASLLGILVCALMPIAGANAQQVSVTAADPSSTVQGTVSLAVTVTGNGFNSSASVKFLVTGTADPGGIVVKNVNVNSAKKLIATIDVADTAVVSKFDIEVALSNGRKGKGTTLFTVQPKVTGKPTTPDGCVTPNVVTEATFPAFVFVTSFEVSPNVFATGTFLADATGKCRRLIGTWPPDEVDFRYNADTNLALVLAPSGNTVVVGLSSVSFGASGPVVTPLSGPTPILDTTEIPLPPDLASTGWRFGGGEFDRISPDGSQLLMKIGLGTGTGEETGVGASIVICSLSYDAGSTIEPIDPATCREVHRYAPLGDKWHEIVAWGALPGTIYSTHPSSVDPMRNSLYRVTVKPPPAPSVVEELFYNGGILMGARTNVAPPGAAVANGEIVAVYQLVPNGDTRCSQAIVIDAYNCTALTCPIVNQKGMRSVTWLPDGRLAGSGQTPPKKGNGTCLENGTFVAYPAIDSSNTPPTVLTTTSISCSAPWRTCIEGSGGGW